MRLPSGRFSFTWLPAMLLALAGCATTPVDDSDVILIVNDEKITERDYASFVALGKAAKPPPAERNRMENLAMLVDRVLLAQRSVELGMGRTDAVRRAQEHCQAAFDASRAEAETGLDSAAFMLLLTRRCRELALAQEFVGGLKDMHFTEAEMRDQLRKQIEQAHKDEYKTRHILVTTEKDALKVKEQLKTGGSFEKIAMTSSIDRQSAVKGGDLGWIKKNWVTESYAEALLVMKKGQVSDPVRSQFGWHVIKLDDVRPVKFPTYEEFMADTKAKDQMISFMRDQRLRDIVKELRNKAKIVVMPSAKLELPLLRRRYINSRVDDPVYRSYLQGWRKQAEERGNASYPAELKEKGATGNVLLSVEIKPDGSVAGVEIRRSSGDRTLDEAARRIAAHAGPFAPLPPEILKEADVLNITTTWKFASREGPKLD